MVLHQLSAHQLTLAVPSPLAEALLLPSVVPSLLSSCKLAGGNLVI